MFRARILSTVMISALLATGSLVHADISAWRSSTGGAQLSNYSQPDLPAFRKTTPAPPVTPRVRVQRRNPPVNIRNRTAATTGRYDTLIREAARRHGVDYKLVKAVVHAESAFNHRAVSSVGAQGLMQLMPATARDLRVSDPFDPRENVDGGTRYLKQMLHRFHNDISLSLAAYNAGPSTVFRYGGIPPYRETQSYIRKVKALMRRYEREEQQVRLPRLPVIDKVYHVIKNGRPVVSNRPLP